NRLNSLPTRRSSDLQPEDYRVARWAYMGKRPFRTGYDISVHTSRRCDGLLIIRRLVWWKPTQSLRANWSASWPGSLGGLSWLGICLDKFRQWLATLLHSVSLLVELPVF